MSYPRRALIIDDDASLAAIFSRCLSLWGWEHDDSPTVAHALELFKRAPYDLALCDADLPDGDGIMLAQALAHTRPSLRVIVVSGDPENIARAKAKGFADCLQKPFDLDVLKDLLVCRGNPAQGSQS